MTAPDPAPGLRSIRAGHAPNCSSAGSVVGVALVSLVAAGLVVNLWADRLLRWLGGGSAGSGPDPRLRLESDGGLLAWSDPPALLRLDARLAKDALQRGATLIGNEVVEPIPGALVAPTEAHLAVTDRCPAACTGCYLSAGPDRPGTDPGDLPERLEELAAMGVVEVAFGGGEALMRADLLDLARLARSLGMVPNLTTSGFGIDAAQAASMAGLFGQVNVSLDGLGATYGAARGWSGAERGMAALRALVGAGQRCGVNTVLSRPLFEDKDALLILGDAIARAGAREWQWLRFKPAGRGAESWDRLAPTPEQLDGLFARALALEARTGLVMRFDCALVPFVASQVGDAERLQRLGVVGCPGGQGLWARSAAGAWSPCSFAEGSPAAGRLDAAWRHDPTLQRWRERAAAPPEPCASCPVQAVCRGGCRVVSAHLLGDAMAPDPQCPRVRGAA